MPYMGAFTINILQMLAYVPYMDPMGKIPIFQTASTHLTRGLYPWHQKWSGAIAVPGKKSPGGYMGIISTSYRDIEKIVITILSDNSDIPIVIYPIVKSRIIANCIPIPDNYGNSIHKLILTSIVMVKHDY